MCPKEDEEMYQRGCDFVGWGDGGKRHVVFVVGDGGVEERAGWIRGVVVKEEGERK